MDGPLRIYVFMYQELMYVYLYSTVTISVGTTFQQMVERQLVFGTKENPLPEDQWHDVETIDPALIHEDFDMDMVTIFLSLSDIMINNKPFNLEVKKPTKKGRKMYMSKCIKRAWFFQTNQEYLLFKCNMSASYATDRR